jgi:hypothetical protein
MGILYLTNIDFLKCGVPASMISALVNPLFLEPDIDRFHLTISCGVCGGGGSKVVASIGYILMLLVK